MKLAVLQLNSQAQWEPNRQQIAALLMRLPAERPLLVLLPENFAALGSTADYQAIAEPVGEGPIQQQLASWARQYGIWLVAGSLPTQAASAERLHTTTLVYDADGQLRGHYHKLHLFDVDVADGHRRYRESDSFAAGNACQVVSSPFGGLGLSICYDVRFPELYRRLRVAGAEILLVPAAFTAVTGAAHWRPLLQARAIENQCYLLAANQGGEHDGGRRTWGHSLIVDPWGRVLGELDDEPGVLIATLDPQLILQVRTDMPVLEHARLTGAWRDEASCC